MLSPVSSSYLMIVLGLTVSLVWGQTPTRLAIGSTTVTAGSTIPMINVGAGGPGGLGISALACFTTSPSTAVWLFPDGGMVPLGTNAAADNTINSVRYSIAITLHRGDGFISPGGEYCCGSPTNENERLCITLASCPALDLANGMVTYTDPDINSVTATHTCNNGYQLSGGSTRTCSPVGGTGVWSGGELTCITVDCGTPPDITNGSPGTPDMTTFGGTVTYTCDNGYQLSGSPTVTCSASGWSTRPTCTAICNDLSLANGVITYSPISYPRLETARATHSCDTGYELSGVTVNPRVCQSDRTWSGGIITCPIVDCSIPPTINGGSRIFTTTTYQSMATYSCNNGYIMTGSPTVICLADMSWSTRPTCIATCDNLPILSNGAITYSPSSSPRMENARATHTCINGYELSGDTVNPRVCQSDRSWSGGDITCTIVDCNMPPTINGGSRIVTTTTYQSTATYSCNSGYIMSGSPTVTCLANGSWSTRPTCTATCDDLSLTNGVITYNPASSPRREGNTATHTCGPGYELSGDTVNPRVCQSDRTWSGGDITCLAMCPDLPQLTNGVISYSPSTIPRLEGATATYSCADGYQLSSDITRTCVDSGTGGTWNGMEPICLAACDDLGNITNGVIMYSTASSPRLQDTVATYSCTMKLELFGAETRTCQNNRFWSGMEPYCQRTFVMLGSMTFVSNNSDIEITDIGEGESIQGGGLTCATDLPTCCRGTDNTDNPGTPLGEWISPNGTEVPGREESNADIYRDRGMGFIRLNRRNNATSPTGLYCCVIPVNGGGMETFCVNITAIAAEVVPPGDSPAAGQSYSLTCTVTGADSLNPTINYQWFKTTPNRTQVGTGSPTLTFDPLVLSDAGLYSCEATISSYQLSQDVTTTSRSYDIKFPTLNIQLRFNGILSCQEYTLLDPVLKISDVTTRLTQGVEDLCGCGFISSLISEAFLECFNEDSPHHVTYRAVLMETSQTSTVELISYIEQWIENAQRVVIQGVRLGINTTCPTTIVDFNSLECPQAINVRSTPPPPTVTDPIAPLPGDIGDIIGGVVAGVFVLVVIVAAVIVIVLVGMRHRKTVSKDVQNNKTKVWSQAVVLSEINQPSLPDPDNPQPTYETVVGTESHEYEDLGKFQEGENYEQVGHPSGPPKGKGKYDFTSCPAYAPTELSGRRATPTTGAQEHGHV